MSVKDVLARLRSLADPARHRHNVKAGAPTNQFGVKLGDVRSVAKDLGRDHALALRLWDTGNVEAQLVATLLLEPAALSDADLDRLTRGTTCAQVADWMNAYVVAKHPARHALRARWMDDPDPWAARAGWGLTAAMLDRPAQPPARSPGRAATKHAGRPAGADVPGLDLDALLDRIERELPSAPPEVQWTMNHALAALGIASAAHRARVLAVGEAIGLYRDWPVSKGCTPPYVPVWVAEMVRRRG